MALEFFCNICHEAYANTHDISSTKCGHVFHDGCITDWLSLSRICPDCGRTCSKSSLVKIFIKSRTDVGEDIQETDSKLTTQLEQGVKKLTETQHLLDESERKYTELTNKLNSVTRELTVLSQNMIEKYDGNPLAGYNDPTFRRRSVGGSDYEPRIDAKALDLFQYAQNLRKIGYKNILFDGSSIIARKTLSHPVILIRSRDDVDDLMYD